MNTTDAQHFHLTFSSMDHGSAKYTPSPSASPEALDAIQQLDVQERLWPPSPATMPPAADAILRGDGPCLHGE